MSVNESLPESPTRAEMPPPASEAPIDLTPPHESAPILEEPVAEAAPVQEPVAATEAAPVEEPAPEAVAAPVAFEVPVAAPVVPVAPPAPPVAPPAPPAPPVMAAAAVSATFPNGKPMVDVQGRPASPKSRLAGAILAWFLGVLGVHRFYVGKVGTGILMILTLGGFGIWALVDFIMILIGSFKDKQGRVLANW